MSNNHIVENLKKEIENFSLKAKAEKVGHVVEVFDGIAKVSGLSDVKSSEMVTFSGGEVGVMPVFAMVSYYRGCLVQ
jgi:F-type H+-transporting ATPase subunit alpha